MLKTDFHLYTILGKNLILCQLMKYQNLILFHLIVPITDNILHFHLQFSYNNLVDSLLHSIAFNQLFSGLSSGLKPLRRFLQSKLAFRLAKLELVMSLTLYLISLTLLHWLYLLPKQFTLIKSSFNFDLIYCYSIILQEPLIFFSCY